MDNSLKVILWIIAGVLIPFWPISLPFCWYQAYRASKRGEASSRLADLKTAAELHQSGVLSDEELQALKVKALGAGQKTRK